MIGPALPPHLVASGGENIGPSIGPQIPAHLKSTTPPLEEEKDEDEPVPTRNKVPANGPSRRPIGPAMPRAYTEYDEDDDDEVGPRPPPSYANVQHDVDDGVKQFIEAEEKRRKQIEEASKPKKLKRDEWMLKPPTSSELLGNLDPTRLKAPRQFSRSTRDSSSAGDSSLWTETPAEKQQRLADEVVGKRRRAVDPVPDDDDKKKRRKEDAFIRKGVDDYTARVRGPSLLKQHTVASEKNKQDKDEPEVIWDHARDMGVGGRLMDDEKRNRFISEARGLGDRFSSGKSGGFL